MAIEYMLIDTVSKHGLFLIYWECNLKKEDIKDMADSLHWMTDLLNDSFKIKL